MDLAHATKRTYSNVQVKIENININCIYLLIKTYLDIDSDEIDVILSCDNIEDIVEYVQEQYPNFVKYGQMNVWVHRPVKEDKMTQEEWAIVRNQYTYLKVVSVMFLRGR
jgi:hypothetical protein